MRVWDFPVGLLCKTHLSGEHREIHGLITVIKKGSGPYLRHPETQRWVNHLDLLIARHDAVAIEMIRRGMNHKSPVEPCNIISSESLGFVDSLEDQLENIRAKAEDPNHKCTCDISVLQKWMEDHHALDLRA